MTSQSCCGSAAVRVRLHGRKGNNRSRHARLFTSELAFRKRYAVVRRHCQDRVDIAGLSPRSCCLAFRPLHHKLVRAGLAWWFRRYASGETQTCLRERLDGHGADCAGMQTRCTVGTEAVAAKAVTAQ